jgi:hypothetical protein
MFKLKFPSGATVEFSKSDGEFHGTLYIWVEDLESEKPEKAKTCEGCGEILETHRGSTTFYREDNFCSARCKRKNKHKRLT